MLSLNYWSMSDFWKKGFRHACHLWHFLGRFVDKSGKLSSVFTLFHRGSLW